MLRIALSGEPAFSIAVTEGGLFVEIAGECRAAYGEGVRLSFLCGRDAAERIVGWDYGRPEAIREMLAAFDLLVAARRGAYRCKTGLSAAVQALPLPAGYDHVSATEVRERIARGQSWQHLVPPAIAETVGRIYGPA